MSGHTLLKVEDLASIGRQSNSYGSFVTNLAKFKVEVVVQVPDKLPEMPESHLGLLKDLGLKVLLKVPENLGPLVNRPFKVTTTFKGGETEALRILKEYLKDK